MLGNIGSTIAQGDLIHPVVYTAYLLLIKISLMWTASLFCCFTGMAFGTGSAVAHRAVDAVMGPRTVQHEMVGATAPEAQAPTTNSVGGSDACSMHTKAFQDVS